MENHFTKLLILTLFLHEAAQGLRCHRCFFAFHENKQDGDRACVDGENIPEKNMIECAEDEDLCSVSFAKNTQGPGAEIARGCTKSFPLNGATSGCEECTRWGITNIECVCNSDRCNHDRDLSRFMRSRGNSGNILNFFNEANNNSNNNANNNANNFNGNANLNGGNNFNNQPFIRGGLTGATNPTNPTNPFNPAWRSGW